MDAVFPPGKPKKVRQPIQLGGSGLRILSKSSLRSNGDLNVLRPVNYSSPIDILKVFFYQSNCPRNDRSVRFRPINIVLYITKDNEIIIPSDENEKGTANRDFKNSALHTVKLKLYEPDDGKYFFLFDVQAREENSEISGEIKTDPRIKAELTGHIRDVIKRNSNNAELLNVPIRFSREEAYDRRAESHSIEPSVDVKALEIRHLLADPDYEFKFNIAYAHKLLEDIRTGVLLVKSSLETTRGQEQEREMCSVTNTQTGKVREFIPPVKIFRDPDCDEDIKKVLSQNAVLREHQICFIEMANRKTLNHIRFANERLAQTLCNIYEMFERKLIDDPFTPDNVRRPTNELIEISRSVLTWYGELPEEHLGQFAWLSKITIEDLLKKCPKGQIPLTDIRANAPEDITYLEVLNSIEHYLFSAFSTDINSCPITGRLELKCSESNVVGKALNSNLGFPIDFINIAKLRKLDLMPKVSGYSKEDTTLTPFWS